MTIPRALRRLILFAVLANLLGASLAWAQTDLADITVSKSGPAEATAGSNVTYTVTVVNNGPNDVSPRLLPTDPNTGSITLTDNIPSGMTFVSAAPPGCSTPAVGSGGSIVCTIDSLATMTSVGFTFVFNIPSGTTPGTVFTNVATVTLPNRFSEGEGVTNPDPNDENNTAFAITSTPAPPQADVSVNKTGPEAAAPDTDVVYTIVVSNGGPGVASSVTLSDALPGTMTFVSLSPSGGPGLTCTTPAAGSTGTVTCTIGSVGAGASITFTLTGHVPAGTPPGTDFTNTASAAAATSDPNTENNTSSTGLTVSAIDISVTKLGPPPVNAGETITYTLQISSAGSGEGATAVNVQLSDALPPNTTFVSLTPNPGPPTPPASTCSTPPVDGTGTVTCTFPTFPSGASASFTLVIRAGDTTSVTNTVTASSDSVDFDPANNSASVTTTVNARADVSVTKTGPTAVGAGANVTYTVTLTNAGPSDAASVSLSDTVPPGTTFVSESQTTGPTFACATPAPGATGTITCTIATLPAGASATFSIVVNVSSGTTGTITNTATVSSSTSDPSPGNNGASTTATVSAVAADLSIAKTSIGPAAGSVTFTIAVTNSGPAAGQNVVMTDVLPAGTTLTSVATTQGSCTSGSTVTCALGTLPVGSSVTITIVVSIQSNAAVSNTATVAGAGPDPNLANNSSTVAVGAAAIPTLSAPTFALLALVLIVAGFWVLRRRRPASTR